LKILFIIIILIVFSPFAYGDGSNQGPFVYQPLIQRLSMDGFEVEFLSKLFSDPRAEFNASVLMVHINAKEDPERYQKFLAPESILVAKKFLRQNLTILKKMERRFQVEKEVAVAILLVESRFGKNTGKYRVIPTLASMALMDSPENLQEIYQNLRENDPDLSYEQVESFAKRRAEWAYHELDCLLRIIRQEEIDPLEIYGSYAGAVGMAQFIPSSYLTHALSKKGFKSWLLSEEDAINSIGNYLESHGWKRNLSIKKKKQLIRYYNRSDPYIETILKVAQKIKER
jgi:membrane-bound lytic murein transglycosylase B